MTMINYGLPVLIGLCTVCWLVFFSQLIDLIRSYPSHKDGK